MVLGRIYTSKTLKGLILIMLLWWVWTFGNLICQRFQR